MRTLIALSFVLLWTPVGRAQECMPSIQAHFITDLCTGYREGTRKNPHQWEKCCVLHDLRLWAGGTKKQRRQTDKLLRQCVRDSGSTLHATLMWLGVRGGSLSPIKIKGKQWGNAWGDKTRREALDPREIALLEQSLRDESSLSEEEIEDFVQELQDRTRP